MLSAAFNRAVRYGWLAANPCVQATKPKVSTLEIEPPPPDWVRSIIAAAEGVNDDLAVWPGLQLLRERGVVRSSRSSGPTSTVAD